MNRLILRALNRLSVPSGDQDQVKDQGGVAAEYGVLLAGIVGVVAIAAATLDGRIVDVRVGRGVARASTSDLVASAHRSLVESSSS